MRSGFLISLFGVLFAFAGCPSGGDDDSAVGDDDTSGDDDAGDDDTGEPGLGFAVDGALDTISQLTFTPDLSSLGVSEATLQVSWTFGDGATLDPGPVQPAEHQYLAIGPYTVIMQYESTEPGGPAGSVTESVTIDYPDYWPTIVPCYYIGGFTSEPVDDLATDPYNVRAVMVAAFDLYDTASSTVDQDLIDELHRAGLLVWVDVAQWDSPWNSWSDMGPILVALVEAGVDGIDFDEFGSGGPGLSATSFNQLQSNLRAVNPYVRLAITQRFLTEIEELLDDGATPDYFALEWYLAGVAVFDDAKDLSIDRNIRFAYWVDPSTYDKIEQTYDEANAVFMWNLCWSESTCDDQYPFYTWVPWEYVAPHVMGLGPGLEEE